jgi:hypothetical protein
MNLRCIAKCENTIHNERITIPQRKYILTRLVQGKKK